MNMQIWGHNRTNIWSSSQKEKNPHHVGKNNDLQIFEQENFSFTHLSSEEVIIETFAYKQKRERDRKREREMDI